MTAPKAKKSAVDVKENSEEKGIQFVVFAPINADPNDEDSRIYMVCPSSLKVVEIVEKFGEEADNYLSLLGKNKKKSTHSSSTFIDDLGDAVEVDDSLVEDGSGYKTPAKADGGIDDTTQLESFGGLEEDVVAFANDDLLDIFPDDGDHAEIGEKVTDVDMADALALLDQDEDEVELTDLDDFSDDDGELPSL